MTTATMTTAAQPTQAHITYKSFSQEQIDKVFDWVMGEIGNYPVDKEFYLELNDEELEPLGLYDGEYEYLEGSLRVYVNEEYDDEWTFSYIHTLMLDFGAIDVEVDNAETDFLEFRFTKKQLNELTDRLQKAINERACQKREEWISCDWDNNLYGCEILDKVIK
jgi:hypothetical protein